MLLEWVNAVGNVIFWGALTIALLVGPDKLALQATFLLGALLSIAITRQRFAALQ